MSDTPTQAPVAPTATAPEGAAPTGESQPGAAKPSRFRTDASAVDDPLLNKPRLAPIKETPPKDPATGKFVKADPNAGVIPELQGGQVEVVEEPPQQEEAQPAEPPAPAFTPVEFDLGDGRVSVFKTKEALDAFVKQLRNTQMAEARRAADLQKLLDAKSPKEEVAAVPTEKLPTNPFEASLIDDTDLLKQMYEDIDDPQNGPVIAIARVIDKLESRMRDLVKFIQHERDQATQPMQQFLNAMNSINTTSEFFHQMTSRVDEQTGEALTPVKSRREIRDLTRIMHKHNLALTPENFDLAYQVLRSEATGEPQPRQGQPPQDNTAAASAAAVLSSRGTRVPDPRAEKRSPTFREEMDAVPMNRGRFRTVS